MTGFWILIMAGAVFGLIGWFSTFNSYDDEDRNDYED